MNALHILVAWTIAINSWLALAQSKWVATKVSDYLTADEGDVLYKSTNWNIVILPWSNNGSYKSWYPEWLFWGISETIWKKHGNSYIYIISQDKHQSQFLIKVDWTKDVEKTGWTIFYIVNKDGKILKIFTDYYLATKAIK